MIFAGAGAVGIKEATKHTAIPALVGFCESSVETVSFGRRQPNLQLEKPA